MFDINGKIDDKLLFLVEKEKLRQKRAIDLIASENFAPDSVLKLIGSELTNKYSEGYPKARYYPGNEIYDKIENIARLKALKLFKLSPLKWDVNVQPYSGAIANLAIYNAFLSLKDKILSMGLSSGGHLSHGSRASFTGKLFNFFHYDVDEFYDIDYSKIKSLAKKIKPKMIVSGASAYPKKIDFKKIGQIAGSFGALHLADISHYAGLISAQKYPSPFDSSDIVMTTTHKSLFGPRAAVIFVNKESEIFRRQKIDPIKAINKSIFPGIQGGPHENIIAAIAQGMILSSSKNAKNYYSQVIKNANTLCLEMKKLGFEIVGGETQSHLFLFKTDNLKIDGAQAEKLLEEGGILANRNMIFGDTSPFKPSAVRVGVYAVTTMGMKEKEMKTIAGFIKRILIDRESPKMIKKEAEILRKKFK